MRKLMSCITSFGSLEKRAASRRLALRASLRFAATFSLSPAVLLARRTSSSLLACFARGRCAATRSLPVVLASVDVVFHSSLQ